MTWFAFLATVSGVAAMAGAVMQLVDYFERPAQGAKKDRFGGANAKAVGHR